MVLALLSWYFPFEKILMGKEEVVKDSSLVPPCLSFVFFFVFLLATLSISYSNNSWSLEILPLNII